MRRRLLIVVLCAFVAAPAVTAGASADDSPPDRVYNVLPPGQSGSLPPDVHSTDQLPLYDGLTPLFDKVKESDITRLFKSERFGLANGEKGTEEKTPRRGLTVLRDSWGVPHVYGKTRADVSYGAGWVTAHDRSLLLEVLRGPARLAAVDAPGVDAFTVASSLGQFEPSAQTERYLESQRGLLLAKGAKGRQVLADVDNYVAGINAYYRATGNSAAPWTRRDLVAMAALIGAVFGRGGGDEVRRSAFLAALRQQLGQTAGDAVYKDLREANDPEAPTTISQRFPYERHPSGPTPGSRVVDPGSQQAPAPTPARHMSNVQLVAPQRSASGRPLAVMGPQVGYYYPEILMEMDLHGGGIDARGTAFPGVSLYVLLGRGKDYAWSATSSGSDVVDQFLEELCNPDGSPATRASAHYRYKGSCRAMTTFDAGVLKGSPDRRIIFKETVHGPVAGTVTVKGKPYAIANLRSTRGRESLSALAFADLNTNAVRSAKDFAPVMDQVEFTFNWFYVDNRDIAYYSSGRLPRRAKGTETGLPTLGTGQYDWTGFLSRSKHPQAIDPPGGLLLNWNNKPAPAFGAADDNWGDGSVDHVELFTGFKERGNQLHDVVSVMNKAATQDARAVLVWPVVARVLATGAAPNARAGLARDLVNDWVAKGGSRLDRDLNGTIDHPGAAIVDAAWNAMGDAALSPVLGPLLDGLHQFNGNDDYVDKDLRTLLGEPVKGKFSRAYCGNGDLRACRQSLWAAFSSAVDRLVAEQGPDPRAWRSAGERTSFAPGLLPDTIRRTNRPTFQQVVEFGGPVRPF